MERYGEHDDVTADDLRECIADVEEPLKRAASCSPPTPCPHGRAN